MRKPWHSSTISGLTVVGTVAFVVLAHARGEPPPVGGMAACWNDESICQSGCWPQFECCCCTSTPPTGWECKVKPEGYENRACNNIPALGTCKN